MTWKRVALPPAALVLLTGVVIFGLHGRRFVIDGVLDCA